MNSVISRSSSKFSILQPYPPNAIDLSGSLALGSLQLGSFQFPDPLGNFTLEFWFKPIDVTTTNQTVFALLVNGNDAIVCSLNHNYANFITYPNKLSVFRLPGSGGVGLENYGYANLLSRNLTANVWYHVALQRTGLSANGYQLFINGFLDSIGTSDRGITAGSLVIGRRYTGSPEMPVVSGTRIAGFRLSNRARYRNLPGNLNNSHIGRQFFIPSKGQINLANQTNPSLTDNYSLALNFTSDSTKLELIGSDPPGNISESRATTWSNEIPN